MRLRSADAHACACAVVVRVVRHCKAVHLELCAVMGAAESVMVHAVAECGACARSRSRVKAAHGSLATASALKRFTAHIVIRLQRRPSAKDL
jgi:hypothetical protein